jgi:methylenetetrahydrofolate dehydrogenase (NADP+)/methenyltetrahydrofolate cyclohydrolase
VSAVGKPKLVDLKKCKKARVVIDVGVNRVDGKLCGDCFNFDENENENLLVTPVPKGIGLMTRAMLMKHISETNQVR